MEPGGRPTYAPSSPRERLSPAQRVLLHIRWRARRGWSVQDLLDERAQMLETLDALERLREDIATKVRSHVADKPRARHSVERSMRKLQGKIDDGAEIVRHRLKLGDSLLSARGARPWEDERAPRSS